MYGVWCIKITNQENEIDESFATYNLRGCLIVVFKNYFFVLENKKTLKTCLGKGSFVYFLCFSCSQEVTIFKTIKKIFLLFFHKEFTVNSGYIWFLEDLK